MDGRSPAGAPAGELLPGERELWTGGPARVPFRLSDVGNTVWALGGITVLFVVWFHRSGPTPSGLVAAAFAVPTAVGGACYFLVVRRAVRRRDVYTVTDLRVLLASGLGHRRTASVYLDQIGEPSVTPGRHGTGTIKLKDDLELADIADAAAVCSRLSAARLAMIRRSDPPAPPPAAGQLVPVPDAVTLAPGERVVWTGRASGRVPVWFGWTDAYYSAFGVYAVAFIGTVLVPIGAGSWPFGIFGLLGLYLAAGRLAHRRALIGRSVYVLTDRRLIACWHLTRPGLAEARLRDLRPPESRASLLVTAPAEKPPDRKGGSPGSGGAPAGASGFLKDLLWPAAGPLPVLAGVPGQAAVRDLICAAQLAAR